MIDDSTFVFFFVVGTLLKLIVPLAIAGGIAFAIVRAVKGGGGGHPMLGLGADPFTQHLQLIQQLVAQAEAVRHANFSAPPASHGVNLAALPPRLQVQFNAAAQRAERDLRAMDATRRSMAETRMAGMMSDASAAGIDVSSWRFRN
jgi:hypothetical protein